MYSHACAYRDSHLACVVCGGPAPADVQCPACDGALCAEHHIGGETQWCLSCAPRCYICGEKTQRDSTCPYCQQPLCGVHSVSEGEVCAACDQLWARQDRTDQIYHRVGTVVVGLLGLAISSALLFFRCTL